MIKLCKNLFYKPKYGSDADSMMLKHLFFTVTTILMCLAAISFSAYAFFSHTVTSGANTIKSSSFAASITIKKDQKLVTEGKIQSYYFDTPGLYTVTIRTDDEITGTGYGVITVKDTNTPYYTQQLGKDLNAPNQERKEISFQLDVKATATVTFEARWGTNSHYDSVAESEFYIKNDPQKTIVINATQGVTDDTGETESEQTASDSATENTTGSATESTTESTTPETTVPTADAAKKVHTVQSGESLALIAEQYGTTYSVLAAYNDIDDPRVIQPGQKILIPSAEQESPEPTTPPETTPETTAPTEQTELTATAPEETQAAVETTEAALQ